MVYRYECPVGHKYEAEQPFASEPDQSCDVCGGMVNRVIEQTSFALKGDGWGDDGYDKERAKE